MRCPACLESESRVVDSRTAGESIRRRRQCSGCGERFTTHERVEPRLPWVVKKSGTKEPFDREKVFHGIALACRKRPLGRSEMEEVVHRVERVLAAAKEPELPSSAVGKAVMAELKTVDPVAYVRFASVYREFESIEQFVDTIIGMRALPDDAP
jgi:transcriptional repressor NrdR